MTEGICEKLYVCSRGDYLISTDLDRLDRDAIVGFLAQSYWANTRTRTVMDRSIDHSLCFGLYHTGDGDETEIGDASDGVRVQRSPGRQVGFARVVTDYATFAYLCDVFIADEVRGKGLGKWLIESVISHADLQGLRRWMLATADAHELYRKFGFTEMSAPTRWMERFSP